MRIFINNEEKEIADNSFAYTLSKNTDLAVSINGKLRDLKTILKEGDKIHFVDFESKEGKELFWHSSAHILAQAVMRLFPNAYPTIGPAIDTGGFYFDFANLKLSEEDLIKIEAEAEKIIKEDHRPERILFNDKKEALEKFKNNPYKIELIQALEGEITAYSQGEFTDLCRGPHLPKLGLVKGFKVLKTSGAYWRADQTKEMLTRIYGISFPKKEMVAEYLEMVEQAKKRDHKVLGPALGLFSIQEEAPGMPFIHPNGMVIWNALVKLWRELHIKHEYQEIKTPQIMSRELWVRSGHWDNYRDNMYFFSIEDRDFAIKPMSCPGCMLYFNTTNRSYRELPLRIAEFGHVHRHEASGALSGLMRVRSFHQDDAHIFMRPQDIKNEITKVLELIEEVYSFFGLKYRLELSTRPEKGTIGSDEDWQVATAGLKDALDSLGRIYRLNEGDGAFYGPKIDIHITDAIGRSWQCGTIQLDMALPERFKMQYVDQDSQLKRPVMIHRAIFGSIERFFGILIEHFAGKFPLWISPRQIAILPVADVHMPYAKQIAQKLKEKGFLVDIKEPTDTLGKRIRSAQLEQYNYMLTLGDKERENAVISVRLRDNRAEVGSLALEGFISKIEEELKTRRIDSIFS